MKSIAIHLQKGGVGKTSLCGAISFESALHNKKTLMIDADPQGNLTNWYAKQMKKEHELANMLYGQADVRPLEISQNLFLLPTFSLNGQLKLYGENQLSNEPFIFCDLLEELEKFQFDLILFDLSPGMSRLEKSVLIAVDEVWTPMTPEYFSLDGLEIFHSEIKKLEKSYKKEVCHQAIIINNFHRAIKQHQDVFSSIPNHFKHYVIPVDPVFRKAQAEGVGIQTLDPKTETKQVLSKMIQNLM